jgi:hypothetical protein
MKSRNEKSPYRRSSASQMTFEGTDLGLGAARPCSLLPPSQTHRSLALDALHRASPDAERLSHLLKTHPFEQPSHLAFGRAVYLRNFTLPP